MNMIELTKSEEQMMEIFWNSKEPLTSVDIVRMEVKPTWKNGLVHNMIRSLLHKGMLKECGIMRYVTQYARQLVPAMTKDEYLARLLLEKSPDSPFPVIRAMIGLAKEDDIDQVISELEAIIKELKKE